MPATAGNGLVTKFAVNDKLLDITNVVVALVASATAPSVQYPKISPAFFAVAVML